MRVEKFDGEEILVVDPEAIRLLAEAAMSDIDHLLRPGHLAQLRKILDDPEATGNDKFVAFDLLKNANIAAGGVLPMCQDTGTAIVMGKKGRRVFTRGGRRGRLGAGRGGTSLRKEEPALFAARARSRCSWKRTPETNLPAQDRHLRRGREILLQIPVHGLRAAVRPTRRIWCRARLPC